MNTWRIQRAAAVCIGILLLIMPVMQLSPLLRNTEMTRPWWTPVCIALFTVSGAALLATATARFRRYLPTAGLAAAAVQMAVLVLWFPAWTGAPAAPDDIAPVWVTGGTALVAVGIAATVGYLASLAYTAGTLTLLVFVYSYAHSGHLILAEVFRMTISGGLIGVFLAVMRAGMITARRVDADRERVLATAAAAAARTARGQERDRLDAVVRDEVITVLRTVRVGEPAQVQRDQAAVALAALDDSAAARPSVIEPWQAQLRLRESIVALSDEIAVAVDVDDLDADYDYPMEVIDALVDATGEAVRNSLEHAGALASQAVVGRLSAEGIRVRVVDDGDGFDPGRIPPDRMGVAMGIRGRMARLPGGAAQVESEPGGGAMVSLEWRRS
ncbi:ATP-binding protein [Gordonia caeni]|uniref:Histidine kinase/HSP90-like ATPase domain-containing protein n=1 Tax=Gordonia caeni TaxID=1007097 RepID=A0ABP7NSN9_9ACTN